MTTTSAPQATVSKPTPVGNGLVLAGAVLYLCEFVGIAIARPPAMPMHPDTTAHALLHTYAGETGAVGFLVGWFALVLPGRALLVLGVRHALTRSGYRSPLLDQAVLLMGLSVGIELVGYALNAGSADAADQGDAGMVSVVNRVAWHLEGGNYAVIGASLTLMAWCLWRSGLVNRVLAGLFGVVGVVNLVNGALLSAPSHAALQDGLSAVNLLMFLLILWLGVVLYRKAARPS